MSGKSVSFSVMQKVFESFEREEASIQQSRYEQEFISDIIQELERIGFTVRSLTAKSRTVYTIFTKPHIAIGYGEIINTTFKITSFEDFRNLMLPAAKNNIAFVDELSRLKDSGIAVFKTRTISNCSEVEKAMYEIFPTHVSKETITRYSPKTPSQKNAEKFPSAPQKNSERKQLHHIKPKSLEFMFDQVDFPSLTA